MGENGMFAVMLAILWRRRVDFVAVKYRWWINAGFGKWITDEVEMGRHTSYIFVKYPKIYENVPRGVEVDTT